MLKNKLVIVSALILIFIVGIGWFVSAKRTGNSDIAFEQISPKIGDIQLSVTTTGVVDPQNRLEIKPSINGRIEEILVREGDVVKKGDVVALMSSTERAALLDAALLQGEQEVSYWEQVYKKTPLIAPIDGVVIVRSVEPGQTVTTSDAVIVLSDRLIVQADVDETDIGSIKIGQKAIVGLDAYPDINVSAVVDHISYESELVNNVNIYSVDIVPEYVPEVFRSGMSANVQIITVEKKEVLTIPLEAVKQEDGKTFVQCKDNGSNTTRLVPVVIGLQDENFCEIVSGLTENHLVLVSTLKSFSLNAQKNAGNPFMPMRGKKK